jgi:hypothetical protein
MGLTLEFLLGNDEMIIEAIQEFDLDKLDENVTERADFSLHLTPNDLNTLSLAASKFNQQNPSSLREFLEVIVDEEDYGLLCIHNEWVRYFAKLDRSVLNELCKEWFFVMQKQYPNEKMVLTDDSVKAVFELRELCNLALIQEKKVFHLWYL